MGPNDIGLGSFLNIVNRKTPKLKPRLMRDIDYIIGQSEKKVANLVKNFEELHSPTTIVHNDEYNRDGMLTVNEYVNNYATMYAKTTPSS